MSKWIARRRRARSFALQALYQWQFNPGSLEKLLSQFLQQPEMVSVDTDFFAQLVKEIIKLHKKLDQTIEPLIQKSSFTPQPVERAILRIGTFELQYCPETPYRVIVNEAIELSKAFGAENSHRFINGVLHAITRACRLTETP